jgi:hypothetical protein
LWVHEKIILGKCRIGRTTPAGLIKDNIGTSHLGLMMQKLQPDRCLKVQSQTAFPNIYSTHMFGQMNSSARAGKTAIFVLILLIAGTHNQGDVLRNVL